MIPATVRIFVCTEAVDMRKSFDTLAFAAKDKLGEDPRSGALFVFANKRSNRMKVLWWDKTGYAIWFKALQEQKFLWPKRSELAVLTLTPQQLDFLLDGYDIAKMKPHQPLKYVSSF